VARFDVHRNADKAGARYAPLLLDVQHDLFDDLDTRVVVPLVRASSAPRPLRRLEPKFDVAGAVYVMRTPQLAGVPRATLGPVVASLAAERAAVLAAIDFLLTAV
jgi:toxin CcdB